MLCELLSSRLLCCIELEYREPGLLVDREALEAVVWFPKNKESDEDESLENHDRKDVSYVACSVEPWHELALSEMVADTRSRLCILVLQMTTEIENHAEVHAEDRKHAADSNQCERDFPRCMRLELMPLYLIENREKPVVEGNHEFEHGQQDAG